MLAATRALDSDLRPKAGTSDLVQDTFLEVQRDFDRLDGTSERDLFAWLTTILKHRLANNILRYHTHKRLVHLEVSIDGIDGDRASPDLPDHDADTPSSVMRRAEETCRVKEAMDSLPPSYQEVIWLRTWQQKSFAEVGKTMDRSSDAARKLWTRAVSQLSKCLDDDR